MGVRPALTYLIGATNVAQKRTTRKNLYEVAIPKTTPDGKWYLSDGEDTFGERVYNLDNTGEWAVKDVVGYIVSERCPEDVARALRVCFPDIFKEDGYREFPIREKRYHEAELLNRGPNAGMWFRDTYEAVRFCADYNLFYEYYDSFTTWYEFQTAQVVLELAGWKFDFGQLKRLLVWNWV